MVVTWSSGWLPQAFRQCLVISLKALLRSTHLGGKRVLLTAVEVLGCLPPHQLPYLSCLWTVSSVGQELTLMMGLYFSSGRLSLSWKENKSL